MARSPAESSDGACRELSGFVGWRDAFFAIPARICRELSGFGGFSGWGVPGGRELLDELPRRTDDSGALPAGSKGASNDCLSSWAFIVQISINRHAESCPGSTSLTLQVGMAITEALGSLNRRPNQMVTQPRTSPNRNPRRVRARKFMSRIIGDKRTLLQAQLRKNGQIPSPCGRFPDLRIAFWLAFWRRMVAFTR